VALFKEASGCCTDPVILAKIYENPEKIDDVKNEYEEAIKNVESHA